MRRNSISILVFVVWLTVAFAFSPVQAQGDLVSIEATDDAYIDAGYLGVNHGNEPTLKLSLTCLIWLKFDLSSIPEGAEGIAAILRLHTAVGGVTNPYFVDACLLQNNFNNSWTEETITAGNCPPISVPLVLDTEYVANNETRYEWNVTEAVVAALDKNSTALTIMMEYASGAMPPQISFKSKEGATFLTEVPTLTVSWTTVIPEYSLFIIPIAIVTTLAVLFPKRTGQNKS